MTLFGGRSCDAKTFGLLYLGRLRDASGQVLGVCSPGRSLLGAAWEGELLIPTIICPTTSEDLRAGGHIPIFHVHHHPLSLER